MNVFSLDCSGAFDIRLNYQCLSDMILKRWCGMEGNFYVEILNRA